MKDVKTIVNECLDEVKALNIPINDNIPFKERCESAWKPVSILFYDNRTELIISEELLKLFPLDVVKAEIIGSILSIDNGKQIYKEGWLEKAAKVQVAYGYDMLNELDWNNLNDLPVMGTLHCSKCGSHYELRGKQLYNHYLDHGAIGKRCKHCGSLMWPKPEEPAKGEPDLQALLQECLAKVHAAGIRTNPIRCIRWKKHSPVALGRCIGYGNEFEIQISEIYRNGRKDFAGLKDTVIHEILHTCDRCQNHGQEFRDHAKKMDEMYGYHIFSREIEEVNPKEASLHHPVICPNCGRKGEIHNKSTLKRLNEKRLYCYFCDVPYVSVENYEKTVEKLLEGKDLPTILQECTASLQELGIPVGNRIRIEWIREYIEFGMCKKDGDGFLIQISDRCKDIRISADDLRDIVIHQMLHTCDGCETHSEKWVDYAKQVDAAFHYQVSVCKSYYEYFHHDEKVRTFMKCHKCGTLRTVRNGRLYDSYSQGKHCTCDWCGSHMLLVDKKRSKCHNLNKLLKQCVSELESIGIHAGKIVNIIYVFGGKDQGKCIRFDDGKYEIQIPYEYRYKEKNEKRLKAMLIHHILHTCTGCDEHNRQWMEYAKKIEKAYNYEILRDCPFDPLDLEGKKIVYKGKCPECGCRVVIKGEEELSYILDHHKRFCSFCSADLKIRENLPPLCEGSCPYGMNRLSRSLNGGNDDEETDGRNSRSF